MSLNFNKTAIAKINSVTVYSESKNSNLYMNIQYTDNSDIVHSIKYSDIGLNVLNDEETTDVFPVLMMLLYFLFDTKDRREEFYNLCYKMQFNTHRRGYYYLGIKSDILKYVINIKIKKELSHLLKYKNLNIVKNQINADPYYIWDPNGNDYVAANDNNIQMHVKYTFDMDILWDRSFDLKKVYEIDIVDSAIVSQKEDYGISSKNASIFIPLEAPNTSQLDTLTKILTGDDFKTVSYTVYLNADVGDISSGGVPGDFINQLVQMIIDFTNLRVFGKLDGTTSDGVPKTGDQLIADAKAWNDLFSVTIGDETFTHLNGFVITDVPVVDWDTETGLIDPNESPVVYQRYSPLKDYLHDGNQYLTLSYQNVPLEWYGTMNTPFDYFWMYDGSVVPLENEDVYGRTYLSERKIITLKNYVGDGTNMSETDLKHYLIFAKGIFVTQDENYSNVDETFVRQISEIIRKYNIDSEYDLLTSDGLPLTNDEVTAQNDFITDQGYKFVDVEDDDGVTQTVIAPI